MKISNDTGYIKLYRKIENNPVWQNDKALKIWLWLLLHARHDCTSVMIGRQTITLHPGELVIGLNKLREKLGYSKDTLFYWINKLEHIGQIQLKKTNKFTLVKIKNWDMYQANPTQIGNKSDANRKQIETNNNYKELRRIKKKNINNLKVITAKPDGLADYQPKEITLKINSLLDLIKKYSGLSMLGGTIKGNRRYAKLLIDKVEKAYPNLDFLTNIEVILAKNQVSKYPTSIDSAKTLYYEIAKIILKINNQQSHEQRNKPKVASA